MGQAVAGFGDLNELVEKFHVTMMNAGLWAASPEERRIGIRR
jgi:hypothetical protein